jgi:hypothetical protein
VEFGAVDRRNEAYRARSSFAGLGEIPTDHFEVLRTAKEIAPTGGPGEVLDLTDMAAEDAGQTVGFHIEKDNGTINLVEISRKILINNGQEVQENLIPSLMLEYRPFG